MTCSWLPAIEKLIQGLIKCILHSSCSPLILIYCSIGITSKQQQGLMPNSMQTSTSYGLNRLYAVWSFLLSGSYIPEGLMTSCTWDYVTYTLANRSYTMMLCCFVFFIPLGIIFYCYLFMFLAIRKTSRYFNLSVCYLCLCRCRCMKYIWVWITLQEFKIASVKENHMNFVWFAFSFLLLLTALRRTFSTIWKRAISI